MYNNADQFNDSMKIRRQWEYQNIVYVSPSDLNGIRIREAYN